MATVHEFPPVQIVSAVMREDRPIRRSQYALSGKRAVSSAGPARREVQMVISGLSRTAAGAGFMAQLWRYLDGGVNLVKMCLPPQNWRFSDIALQSSISSDRVDWYDVDTPLPWQDGGQPLYWFTNSIRTATNIATTFYPALVQVTGLPASTIVARPGDIVRVYETGDDVGVTARVMDLVRTNAAGSATVPLSNTVPDGLIAFADEEDAIFEIMSYAPSGRQFGLNGSINITLREVFESELDSVFLVNTWRA